MVIEMDEMVKQKTKKPLLDEMSELGPEVALEDTPRGGVWWGNFSIPMGCGGRWRIGPLTLTARREPAEWRLAHTRGDDSLDAAFAVECPEPGESLEEEGELVRVVTGAIPESLEIVPLLADRPIVASPEMTFRILPGAEVHLYVSVPLWVRVVLEESASGGLVRHQVLEVPAWRPSDTWFGDFAHGELCYAMRTKARLNLINLPRRRHRAIVKVRVRNRASDVLQLEKINLPAASLSLYADANNHLWTQRVFLERGGDGKTVEVDIGKGAPDEAVDAVLVAPPRVAPPRNVLVRAMGALFS